MREGRQVRVQDMPSGHGMLLHQIKEQPATTCTHALLLTDLYAHAAAGARGGGRQVCGA